MQISMEWIEELMRTDKQGADYGIKGDRSAWGRLRNKLGQISMEWI